jgi:hypothetical protein
MSTPDTYSERPYVPAEAQTPSVGGGRGIVRRWRERRTERTRARLVSARNRRVLAQSLRRTARDANDRDPLRRRRDVLLHYRAAAVRTDLLEIAALLERAHDPDPGCVAALHQLLRDGDSPLYHPGVPAAELRATLDHVRAGLVNRPNA